MEAFTLEVEDRVDNVLEDARTGHRALFGDVADKKDRHVFALRELEQPRGALAQLRDASGRRRDGVRAHCLDRVDDDEDRARAADRLNDRREIGLGEKKDAVTPDAEASRAELDLRG